MSRETKKLKSNISVTELGDAVLDIMRSQVKNKRTIRGYSGAMSVWIDMGYNIPFHRVKKTMDYLVDQGVLEINTIVGGYKLKSNKEHK